MTNTNKSAPGKPRASYGFIAAVGAGDVEETKSYLANGSDADASINGTPLLHNAVMALNGENGEAIADLLLNAGADPNKTNKDGLTALHVACRRGESNERFVDMLLRAGADPNRAGGQDGWTPLHIASSQESIESARLLLEAGADPNLPDDDGMTALHKSVGWGRSEMTSLFLDAGADPNRAAWDGGTPFHLAVACGKEVEASMLLAKGANVCTADVDGKTPLHDAALNGRVRLARLLLDAGADPNITDGLGSAVLHEAVSSDKYSEELVAILLEHGADIDAADQDSRTPVDRARENGRLTGALAATVEERELRQRTTAILGDGSSGAGQGAEPKDGLGPETIVRPAQRARARL